ncbi:MAG: hypothetical protein HC803_00525 [Saprospiraceae bacterium]|nr:hypothetical protein [Saprospiraceae bacterium]
MATDDFGNTYISGISYQADFGSNIPIVPFLGYYLAKLDSTGNVIWTQHIDNREVFTQDILIDSNGDIIVAGHFEGQLNHQGYYANGQIQESSFVFKYDTSGTLIWAETFHSDVNSRRVLTWAATLDANDNIYLTGFFDWNATIGGISISPTVTNKNDIFLLKLNPSGNVVWVKTGGGTQDDEGTDIAYYDNHLYILGNVWSGTMQFDTMAVNIASTSIPKPILIKYSLDGDIQSVKTLAEVETNSYVEQKKIEISSSGTIYTMGRFGGTAIFYPNDTLQSTHYFNGYLARHDLNGNCIWARRLSELADYKKDLTIDANNNVYITDNFIKISPLKPLI